jgi:hypothetical protein
MSLDIAVANLKLDMPVAEFVRQTDVDKRQTLGRFDCLVGGKAYPAEIRIRASYSSLSFSDLQFKDEARNLAVMAQMGAFDSKALEPIVRAHLLGRLFDSEAEFHALISAFPELNLKPGFTRDVFLNRSSNYAELALRGTLVHLGESVSITIDMNAFGSISGRVYTNCENWSEYGNVTSLRGAKGVINRHVAAAREAVAKGKANLEKQRKEIARLQADITPRICLDGSLQVTENWSEAVKGLRFTVGKRGSRKECNIYFQAEGDDLETKLEVSIDGNLPYGKVKRILRIIDDLE